MLNVDKCKRLYTNIVLLCDKKAKKCYGISAKKGKKTKKQRNVFTAYFEHLE